MGLRPIYEDENGFYPATSLPGSAALPFVISTGAQRSGEISVLIPLLGNVFRRSVPGFPTSPLSPATTHVVLRKENHTQLTEAATLDRKSGGAEGSAVLLPLTKPTLCNYPPFTFLEQSCPLATALSLQQPSPFCHPERSRGICSSADSSWKCFSRERDVVGRSAVSLLIRGKREFSRATAITAHRNRALAPGLFFSAQNSPGAILTPPLLRSERTSRQSGAIIEISRHHTRPVITHKSRKLYLRRRHQHRLALPNLLDFRRGRNEVMVIS
jgi:hypothetical protein